MTLTTIYTTKLTVPRSAAAASRESGCLIQRRVSDVTVMLSCAPLTSEGDVPSAQCPVRSAQCAANVARAAIANSRSFGLGADTLAMETSHTPQCRVGVPCVMTVASPTLGRRVLVDGMMGAGKSTFARALAAKTGLPLIHLDLHYWKPGWARPSDEEWIERQRRLIAGDAWIIDGNYNETIALRLERAQSVVYLDTPWWRCARRALVRGVCIPGGEMPEGCVDSRSRRLRDEWSGAVRICRDHRDERDYALSQIARICTDATVHVLHSPREAEAFLDTACC